MSEITYYRGDTIPIKVTLRDKRTLLPIDITGKELLLTVDTAENPTSADNNLVALAGALIDAEGGKATFTPTSPDMDFAPGSYWFDIQMQNPGGSNRQTVAKGRFYHRQDISK